MIALLGWRRHLSDRRLLDCYLADRDAEGIEPRAADHLADCLACGDRFAELTSVLDDVRLMGESEAAGVFTSERLHLQQEQIADRLRMLGHIGRVIAFPAHAEGAVPATNAPVGRLTRVAAGWVAAAAAAGIFIGAGAGMLYDGNARSRPAQAVMTQPVGNPTPAPVRVDSSPLDDDALFMSELEAVRDRPRTEELMAFEALTPHTREITYFIP